MQEIKNTYLCLRVTLTTSPTFSLIRESFVHGGEHRTLKPWLIGIHDPEAGTTTRNFRARFRFSIF